MASNDPCALVTKAEVEAALGSSVGSGARPPPLPIEQPTQLSGATVCQFLSEQPGTIVQVEVVRGRGRSAFDRYRSEEPDKAQLAPVEGVGMEALWHDERRTLVVLEGDAALGILLFTGGARGADPTSNQQRAKSLAAKALGRL